MAALIGSLKKVQTGKMTIKIRLSAFKINVTVNYVNVFNASLINPVIVSVKIKLLYWPWVHEEPLALMELFHILKNKGSERWFS